MTISLESFDYCSLSQEEKREKIEELYIKENLSWGQIAKLGNTYQNRVLRDGRKLGFASRDRSDAQKLALEKGISIHPTDGKKRDKEVVDRIGKKIAENWANLSEAELKERSETSKQAWAKKSPSEVKEMQTKAARAIRQASIEGSKLEKAVHAGLIKAGYRVQFHKEHFLRNERLQLDLFLPEKNIAIEIDGPLHFEDIWGEERLHKSKKRDRLKDGLISSVGLILIRVKQLKNMSNAYGERTTEQIVEKIKSLDETNRGQIIIIEAE